MSCKISKQDGLKYSMELEIDGNTYQRQWQQQLATEAARAPAPKGFRKGRMKAQALEKMLSKSERENMARQIIIRHFIEACNDNDLKPEMHSIRFEIPTILANTPVRCDVTFETLPEIKLNDLKEIKLERLSAQVTDDNIDLALSNLQKQFATWTEKDSAASAEKGDQVTIDFVGSTDEGEFKGGKATDFSLELGSSQMIPGFEDDIYGKKVGDEFTIKVTFPEQYHAKELAGKDAQFKITMKGLKTQQLPTVDQKFIKKVGIADGEIDSLRQELSKHLEQQLKQVIFNKLKKHVITALRDANPIELPESLIEVSIAQLQKETLANFTKQTGQQPPPNFTPEREPFVEQATQQVHIGLLISQIIQENKLKAEPQEIRSRLEEMAAQYDKPNELIEYYQKHQQAMSEIEHAVLENKAIQWVIDHAQVTDKEVSFAEATDQA